MTRKIDKPFLVTVMILTLGGLCIFLSAALSLLAREGANFNSIAFNHIVFGFFGGIISAYIISRIDYKRFDKISLWLFIFSVALTCLVFVPGIGVMVNGSHRWISIFGKTFQPSELLKIAVILFSAHIFARLKDKIKTMRYGLGFFLGISAVVAVIFALQPDTATFGIVCMSLLAMFFAAGGKFKHILLIGLFGLLAFGAMVYTKPYLRERIKTFINPSEKSLGAGYQTQQSLIAIGSGGVTGRGFGKSLQKFNFLPEAISDSIFAVASEELGFIGSVVIILLFVLLCGRGLKIASRVSDPFGRLSAIGLVILLTAQAFVNIASMLAIMPLTGEPLPFISQGGTALLFQLIAIGIIFNISRHQKV